MSKKVRFDDARMMESLLMQLSAEDAEGGSSCPYKEWEILHELDRQVHRKQYDKSPERIRRRQELREQSARVRAYLVEHPEVEKEVLQKLRAQVQGGVPKEENLISEGI